MKKIVFIVIGFLLFLGVYAKINKEAYDVAIDLNDNTEFEFKINKGDGSTEVGENLAKGELIKSKYYFWYYVWKTKTDTKLQAGNYGVAKNMTMPQMVEKFVSGNVKTDIVKLIVPEGSTNDKIIELVKEKKPEIAEEFMRIVKCSCIGMSDCECDKFSQKYAFVKSIPGGVDLEGYLFPDTYFISKNETGATLVSKFLNNFNKKFSEDVKTSISGQDKNIHEIVTLASIVEREAREDKDRPVVAGIFWNRLDINHALQSDATLAYILKTDKMKYYQSDLDKDSPYNTYKNTGLPPGPVSNPGLESVLATIHPTETDYFYFLNNIDTGETVFARTFEQHKMNKINNGL